MWHLFNLNKLVPIILYKYSALDIHFKYYKTYVQS